MRRPKRRLFAATALLIAIACGVGIGIHRLSPGDAPVLSEHRPIAASAPSKQLGESCTENGGSACFSGLCLHVSADRNAGYFCSRTCASSQDCPREWNCAQIYPAADASVCVPPANWEARLTASKRSPLKGEVKP